MRVLLAGVFVLLSLPALAATETLRFVVSERCPAPPGLVTPARPLSRLAAAVAAGGPVSILAVGSGTTSGQDSSGDASFPLRMLAELRERLPRIQFDLVVRGGIGVTAAEMLPLIEGELASKAFSLVIWQTGTVEAVRTVPPSAFRATLVAGADRVAEARSDLVLVGPQFSRVLQRRSDLPAYLGVLTDIANRPDVDYFNRLGLTRQWAESGAVDLEKATNKGERLAFVQNLHACVGEALAAFVLHGIGTP